jgi:Flp pilus assembly secretin CpaC
LLTTKKALLDSLKTKIDNLKAAATNTFKTTHAAILGKTVDTVGIGDESAVNAVLAAYESLSTGTKALLTAEKALLDSLKEKIDDLKAAANQTAANTFKTTHAVILAKTVGTVEIGDETAVDAALAAYGLLSADAKALLTAEKALLDSLKAKIGDLKAATGNPAQEAADAFTTAHAAILAKTVENVAIGDETAVDAALAAYGLLSADAKALLTAEKTLLDSLKTKIVALIAATGSTVTVNLWTDDVTVFATADSVTLSRATFQSALITGLSGAGYTNRQWSINGIPVPGAKGTAADFTFSSLGKSDGKYYVGLQVQKSGIWYSTTITITVE